MRRILFILMAVMALAMATIPVGMAFAVNYTVTSPVVTSCSFLGITTTTSMWTLPLTSKDPIDLVTVTPNFKATIKISHATITSSCLHKTWSSPWLMRISGFYGLTVGTNYSVIYYCDPWPGTGGRELAKFTYTAQMGKCGLFMTILMDSPIPAAIDENVISGGGKIWIVPSSDYVNGQMIVWSPANYLFETSLINLQ